MRLRATVTRTSLAVAVAALLCADGANVPALADDAATATPPAAASPSQPELPPFATKLAAAISSLPQGSTEPEKKDRAALDTFYGARSYAPLWIAGGTFSAPAKALIAAIKGADAFGLSSADFKLPAETADLASPQAQAAAELQLSVAALTYARFARGGRIADPTAQLAYNLDRRPQWIDAKTVLEGLAAAPDAGAYLTALNPKHEQFERLRKLYDAELEKTGGKPVHLSKLAEKLRANMEMWRWLPDDMGTQTGDERKGMYVFNNVPEFTQYVYKDGVVVRTERIVVGQLDKQSAIFSRPLKYVVLRPAWIVPDSIKVHEIWPSILRGGRIMNSFGIEVQKDGQIVDWRKIDWATADPKDYDFVQPPGPRSVLGHVKFSFPSQHTIYMHDTPDKYMFNASVRTLSHGCLRVRNPMQLAEMILKEDKGWDPAKIAELDRSGPLNNQVPIEKRIEVHVAYYTAWVDGEGKLKTFPDIYGHEKRVILGLNGQWDRIDHGKDDQAPVEANFDPEAVAVRNHGGAADDPFAGNVHYGKGGGGGGPIGDLLGALFGG